MGYGAGHVEGLVLSLPSGPLTQDLSPACLYLTQSSFQNVCQAFPVSSSGRALGVEQLGLDFPDLYLPEILTVLHTTTQAPLPHEAPPGTVPAPQTICDSRAVTHTLPGPESLLCPTYSAYSIARAAQG